MVFEVVHQHNMVFERTSTKIGGASTYGFYGSTEGHKKLINIENFIEREYKRRVLLMVPPDWICLVFYLGRLSRSC